MAARPRGRGGALTLALSSASLAGGLFLPLSLVYFTVLTDISLPTLGALLTAAGLVSLPLPLLAGGLIGRVGAPPLVVTALALQAVAYLGFVTARQPLSVFVVSALMAVGRRLFWSSIFALVAEHAETHPGRPVEAWFARLNVIRTVGTVGIVAGGLVAGLAVSVASSGAFLALAWAAATGYGVAAVLVLGTARSSSKPPARVEPSPTATGTSCTIGVSWRCWPSTASSRCPPSSPDSPCPP